MTLSTGSSNTADAGSISIVAGSSTGGNGGLLALSSGGGSGTAGSISIVRPSGDGWATTHFFFAIFVWSGWTVVPALVLLGVACNAPVPLFLRPYAFVYAIPARVCACVCVCVSGCGFVGCYQCPCPHAARWINICGELHRWRRGHPVRGSMHLCWPLVGPSPL